MKMDPEILEKVKRMVQKVKVVYVATANREGVPHIAAAEGIAFMEDEIVFRAWFCPKTVENLRENPQLSLAVLSPKTKEGYQLFGVVERIEKGAILDGYAPGEEEEWSGYPQAEHQLYIRVKAVSQLTSRGHSDEFLD
jgi:general stress protein 26